jgi:hypothetical protein
MIGQVYFIATVKANGKIPAVIGRNRFLHIPLPAIAPEPGFVPVIYE